jgi:hypothetical protein
MTLYDILQVCNLLGGKGLTPEQAELLIKTASLKHFKRKVGLPEQYQPGQPMPQQAFEITKKITQDLLPFKVHMGKSGTVPLYVDAYGYATTPSNLYYPSTMTYLKSEAHGLTYKPIDILDDQAWVDRVDDALTAPSVNRPVANFQVSYIRFSPIKNAWVEFIYLKYPDDPVFGYTQDRGFIEYDSANSTELEWDEANQVDIIAIMLSDLGVNMGRQDILQVAEKVKTQGI